MQDFNPLYAGIIFCLVVYTIVPLMNINAPSVYHKGDGRINIEGPNIADKFAMMDKMPVTKTITSFRDAMIGNWYDTPLSNAFFSAKNIQIVQNAIRRGVFDRSNGNYVIGEQDNDELKIIMRSVFLQYSKNLAHDIPKQIADLNKIVIDYAVEQVYGEADGYMKYKRDVSSMYTLIAPPILAYTNDKQLELHHWFDVRNKDLYL